MLLAEGEECDPTVSISSRLLYTIGLNLLGNDGCHCADSLRCHHHHVASTASIHSALITVLLFSLLFITYLFFVVASNAIRVVKPGWCLAWLSSATPCLSLQDLDSVWLGSRFHLLTLAYIASILK